MLRYLKKYYKPILTIFQWLLPLICLGYLYFRLRDKSLDVQYVSSHFMSGGWKWIVVAIGLAPINWMIEAHKWRFCLRGNVCLSMGTALRSVFLGLGVGIFTPNRIGEYGGRTILLPKHLRVTSALATFICNITQLFFTAILGMFAFMYGYIQCGDLQTSSIFLIWPLLFLLFFLVFTVWPQLILHFIPLQWLQKYEQYFHFIVGFTAGQRMYVLLLSLVRYLVYGSQYYFFMLGLFGSVDYLLFMQTQAKFFLVQSFLPAHAITDISVRGALAEYFFTPIISDKIAILANSTAVWLVNIALPAAIGAILLPFVKKETI